jgi:C4-type Zn-finger protein
MESNGTCSECGYGEEEEYEGEEEGEDDGHMERMIELRDDLQRVVDKLSKLIS